MVTRSAIVSFEDFFDNELIILVNVLFIANDHPVSNLYKLTTSLRNRRSLRAPSDQTAI